MNLRSIDLNLLVVFDALMIEKSITRAARRIGVTPSAVSHALHRLRDTFQDELFVRTPEGMAPSQRALDLHERVRRALAEISRAVDQQLAFDPATSERTFRVRMSDYMSACLLPRVCARVRAEAPRIVLIVDYLGNDGAHEEPGEILVRVCTDFTGPGRRRRRLIQSPFVVAMRGGHPAAAEAMTLDRLASLPFLRASRVGLTPVDEMLARRGILRWIGLTVPTLAAVMPIVEHSDLCAVLPECWVERYGKPGRVLTVPLPLPEVMFTVDLIWHRADEADAGHRWLRNLIEQEFAVLFPAEFTRGIPTGDPPDLLDCFPVVAAA